MTVWFGVLLCLSLANYYAGRKDCLYPAFVLSSIWAAVVLVYCVSPIGLDYVSASTMFLIVSSLLLFSLACWLSNTFTTGGGSTDSSSMSSLSLWLLVICVIGAALFIADTVRIISESEIDSPLVAVKAAMVAAAGDGSTAYGNAFIRAVPNVTFVTALVFVAENRYPRLKWFAVALALLCGGLTGGRTYLFRVFVGCAFLVLMRVSDRSFLATVRRCAVPLALIAAGLVFEVLLTKSETSSEMGGISLAAEYFFVYFCGGVAGFDYALHNPTFAKSLYIGPVNDVAWVPFPTNVYTIFGFYYFRLGLLAVVLVMLMLGAIHGFLYKRGKSGPLWSVFCAVSMYPLCLSFFDDEYRLVGTYIKFCALLLAYKYLRGIKFFTGSLLPQRSRAHA